MGLEPSIFVVELFHSTTWVTGSWSRVCSIGLSWRMGYVTCVICLDLSSRQELNEPAVTSTSGMHMFYLHAASHGKRSTDLLRFQALRHSQNLIKNPRKPWTGSATIRTSHVASLTCFRCGLQDTGPQEYHPRPFKLQRSCSNALKTFAVTSQQQQQQSPQYQQHFL